MHIIISGANGFIGSELINFFAKNNKVLAISRDKIKNADLCLDINQFLDNKNLSIIKNFEPTHFIHTAAIAHCNIKNKGKLFEEAKYINQILPLELYLYSNKLGIKKFIFLSSIGVNGFYTKKNKFFNEDSNYAPYDIYTEFKSCAEKLLIRNSKKLCTDLIILRPAVVYGKNAPGNFRKLVKLIDFNTPFILSKKNNQRSILYIKNLVSAISKTLTYPIESPKVFVISDKEKISTNEIIRIISKARKKRIFILRLPYFIFIYLKKIPFLRRKLSQLVDSLVIDSSCFAESTNWEQPFLQETALSKSFSK